MYSLIKHRKSKGAEPAAFSHSMTAEIVWTAIPVVILLLMAVPAAETMVKLEDSRDPDLSIVVTAYQWKWHYKYQDEDIAFYSSLARPSVDARRKQSGIDPNGVENYLLDVDRPVVVLAAHDLARIDRGERLEHLDLLVADRVGVEARGGLHGDQAEQLREVVLDHVAQPSGLVVIARPGADAEGRGALRTDAIRLCRSLVALMPDEPEAVRHWRCHPPERR